MIQPQFQGQLGFSITSPFKAVAKGASAVGKGVAKGVTATGRGVATATKATGRGISTGVQATGHGIAVGAKATAHGVVVGTKAVGKGALVVGKLALKPAEWLLNQAMRPVRSKVHTLRDRRANKLAWDKRKSRTPNPAERAEAASWTKAKLKSQGPHGQVLALFAGPPVRMLSDYESAVQFGDPVTATAITASIPVFLAIMKALLDRSSKSGEAPANIGPGGQPMPEQPDAPGTVDMTPVQETAQSMAEDAAAAAGELDAGGGGGGGGGAMMQLPGVGPVKQSHLIAGGAIVGGLLLIMLLTRRKD